MKAVTKAFLVGMLVGMMIGVPSALALSGVFKVVLISGFTGDSNEGTETATASNPIYVQGV